MTDNIAADQSGADERESVADALLAIHASRKLASGVHGQILGMETYVIKASGNQLAELLNAAYLLKKSALSSNAAQSAGQEPVEIDLMTGDVLYVNSYRVTPQEMPIGARIVKTWKIDPKELRAAIPDLFGTHPSSAAQVEEIRNAERLEFVDRRCFFYTGIEGRLLEATRKNIDAAIKAEKTAAPSKGEE